MTGLLAAAAAALVTAGGYRLDVPQDAAPPVLSVLLDARWLVLPDAFAGAELLYGGGLDDRNPEKTRVFGKFEGAATLGWRPMLGESLHGSLSARLGVAHVAAWPRGTLRGFFGLGPMAGVEGGMGLPLWTAWGHPMGLEARGGYTQLRIDGVWVGDPSVGLYVMGQLLPEPAAQ